MAIAVIHFCIARCILMARNPGQLATCPSSASKPVVLSRGSGPNGLHWKSNCIRTTSLACECSNNSDMWLHYVEALSVNIISYPMLENIIQSSVLEFANLVKDLTFSIGQKHSLPSRT